MNFIHSAETSDVTTDPADPAMRGPANLGDPVAPNNFSESKNTKFAVTKWGFLGAKML